MCRRLDIKGAFSAVHETHQVTLSMKAERLGVNLSMRKYWELGCEKLNAMKFSRKSQN